LRSIGSRVRRITCVEERFEIGTATGKHDKPDHGGEGTHRAQ
jgi:hypothetical protein